MNLRKGSNKMIINDVRKPKTTRFDCLKIGDVFYDTSELEEFLMKTPTISDYHDNHYNAVSLETGNLFYFTNEEMIEQVKATLTVSC